MARTIRRNMTHDYDTHKPGKGSRQITTRKSRQAEKRDLRDNLTR